LSIAAMGITEINGQHRPETRRFLKNLLGKGIKLWL
jgi:hypothetical protein